MKKVKKTKTAAQSSAAKKKAKSKLASRSKVPVTPIHDTSGGEMPNPTAKSRVSRKDVRLGFR
ncbi:MAG: hypothetical protein ACXVCP_09810 [Bdellovibrio sp.]